MLIVVADVTTLVRQHQAVERTYATEHAELERLGGLIQRLGETNRQLLQANDDLAETEERLRTPYEEYLALSAQAQAASEELETYNEELQATNEELETPNEELKATIEELNTTNADLTARSEELGLQQALAEQGRAELAAVLAGMRDAVVVDGRVQVLRTNAAYETVLAGAGGANAPHDAEGEPLRPEAAPLQRAARGETFRLEFTVPTADGARRWFEVSGQPLSSTTGMQARGVVVIRDITDRGLRGLQEQFVAQAAHELRTPLTALSGQLQLLRRRLAAGTLSDAAESSVRAALEQVQRLRALIDELTDVSRLQTGELQLQVERLDLAHVATRAVSVAQAVADGQTITMAADPAPLWVHGDARRLEQVLLNLLVNAIKYAPGTERIGVRLRPIEGVAELQVEDQGPGITAAELPKIFSRFYQALLRDGGVPSGLGLGLFLAQEIVTAHGARIEVQSREGQGTTFTVRLPLADPLPAGQA